MKVKFTNYVLRINGRFGRCNHFAKTGKKTLRYAESSRSSRLVSQHSYPIRVAAMTRGQGGGDSLLTQNIPSFPLAAKQVFRYLIIKEANETRRIANRGGTLLEAIHPYHTAGCRAVLLLAGLPSKAIRPGCLRPAQLPCPWG